MALTKDQFIITSLTENTDVEKAAQLLYDTYWKKLRSFILGYVRSPSDADDIAQESMIRFLRKVQKSGFDLNGPAHVKTYLLTTGKNTAFEFMRDKKYAERAEKAFSEKETDTPEPDTDADQEASAWETFSRLGAACQRLIRLFLEGKKSPEVREILGISSEENVRAQKKRCLQKLDKLQHR